MLKICQNFKFLFKVFQIRIRIRKLPGSRSGSINQKAKKGRKILIFTILWLFNSSKTYVNVYIPTVNTKYYEKNYFLLSPWKLLKKRTGSGFGSESKRQGSGTLLIRIELLWINKVVVKHCWPGLQHVSFASCLLLLALLTTGQVVHPQNINTVTHNTHQVEYRYRSAFIGVVTVQDTRLPFFFLISCLFLWVFPNQGTGNGSFFYYKSKNDKKVPFNRTLLQVTLIKNT